MRRKKPSTLGYFVFIIQFGMMLSSGVAMPVFSLGMKNGLLQGNASIVAVIVFFNALFEILLALVLSRTLVKNLLNINEATKKVAKGDFSVRIDEEQKTKEWQSVAENFNKMATDLSQTETLRSDFIRNISHELKTPIAKISGYAELLKNPSLPPEKRTLYAETIARSANSLASLTDGVLLLSRLEQCDSPLEKQTFSLDEQLRECVLTFANEWTEKGISIEIDENPVSFYGNKLLLTHVWQNLIGNAVKFTQRGGTIQIRAQKQKNGVIVCVQDNGIGMDEATQRRIFDKFFQADRSHATVGNGLGLSLCKKIVELHGGEIEVVSRLKEGSLFTVFLPDQK